MTADALSKILPSVIDKLTPDDAINEDTVKSKIGGIDLGDVADLVGSFFKKT